MLNRRHIRIKVMQSLYAFNLTDGDDLGKLEKFLIQSLNDMYDLHLSMLALFVEVYKRAEDYNEKSQNNLLSTVEAQNTSSMLVNNSILQALANNKLLEKRLEDSKQKFWYLDFEYVDIIFKEILKHKVYTEYIKNGNSGFKAEKQLLIDLYSEVIATNDQLYEHFEDKKLTWLDDLPVINTTVLKLIKKYKITSTSNHFLPKLYKDDDDREYALLLLKKTVLNLPKYNKEITEKTTNWDTERIAKMDKVMLQMAICEFQEFPSIPFKVTINEYLEIAKEYSTPKSSMFINGILDKLVREYNKEEIHKKVGRGLL